MRVSKSQSKAPVAFFIFRREQCSARVLDRIREYRPSKLLLVADGPRSEEEASACERTRRLVVESIDWNCEVLRNFSDENLGCKERLASGLDWVFSLSGEAIVLEDDCLPSSSFFDYCNAMLSAFRSEESVLHIGGTSPLSRSATSNAFRFSRYNRIWGWANWSRSWKHFDKNIDFWPSFRDSGGLEAFFSPEETAYWTCIFDKVHAGEIDTWDYQWFLCRLRHGVAIEPTVNLVSNIGFGSGSTNTRDRKHPLANQFAGEFQFPAVGPGDISVDPAEDRAWWFHLKRERGLIKRIFKALTS